MKLQLALILCIPDWQMMKNRTVSGVDKDVGYWELLNAVGGSVN